MSNDKNNVGIYSVGTESKLMVRHSFIYGIGSILDRSIAFLMLPIYTRFLTPADYGILELLAITTDILGMLVSLRINRAMYRFYFEYEAQRDQNEVISTSFLMFGGIGLAGVALACFVSGSISVAILDSVDYRVYFIINFVTLWLNTIVMMAFDYLQMLKKSAAYVALSASKLFVGLLLVIYFIVILKKGVLGMLYGNLISSSVFLIILMPPILFKVGVNVSKRKFLAILRYGLPLLPGSVANYIVLVSDRYFVKMFGSLADTGIYSLSYRFGLLPHSLVTIPFFNIWSVRRFELLKRVNAEELMGRIITYFFAILTFVGLGISILGKDVLLIMAHHEFWSAYRYIPILILSYIIFGLFNHFAMGILISKKTEYMSYIDIANGVMNVGLNIILIKRFGIYGGAFATLISYTFRIAALFWVSNRFQKIYFEFGRATKILVSAALLYWLSTFVSFNSIFLNIISKSLILMLYPLSLSVLRFYSAFEVEGLKTIVRKILRERSLKFVFTVNGDK